MTKVAIIIDDLAADRLLVARILKRSGWKTYAVANTVEGNSQLETTLKSADRAETILITDLDMPNDPAHIKGESDIPAGLNFVLHLRTRMERQELWRIPIVALTGLTEQELHVTARAFGCDVVLPKPATLNLADLIEKEWQRTQTEEAIGNTAMLRLLRSRLDKSLYHNNITTPELTEQDITKALLSYRREGAVGLGNSLLSKVLVPGVQNTLQRGEQTYNLLLKYLREFIGLDTSDVLKLIQGELREQATPAELCAEMGISQSEYYRRRREAISVLLEMLAGHY